MWTSARLAVPEMDTPAAESRGLAVVCTDSGQHPRTQLARVNVRSKGHLGMPGPDLWSDDPEKWAWSFPIVDAEPGSWESRGSYRFTCRRCGRDVRVVTDRWWPFVHGALRLGWSSIDISGLG